MGVDYSKSCLLQHSGNLQQIQSEKLWAGTQVFIPGNGKSILYIKDGKPMTEWNFTWLRTWNFIYQQNDIVEEFKSFCLQGVLVYSIAIKMEKNNAFGLLNL
jgi:hypothetical protein